MKTKKIRKLFEKRGYERGNVGKHEVYKLKKFIQEDLPEFWDALVDTKSNLEFYNKTIVYPDKLFTVFMFKHKGKYFVAYADEFRGRNVDIQMLEIEELESYLLNVISDEMITLTLIEEKKKEIAGKA